MKKLISILLILLFAFSFSSCEKADAELNVDDLHAICELSTVKCYYNNVAQIIKEKENIFQKDRKMWIEYEGEASIGIDMSKLEVKVNDENVTIKLPEAEILNIGIKKDTLNKNSYSYSADGVIFKNKITTEDQEEGIKAAQKQMKKVVQENTSLFTKAENKAKELMKNYITKIGEATGVEYVIKWK